MGTFKARIEAIRLKQLLERFPDNDEEWCMKFWYASAIEYTKGTTAAKIEKNIISYIKLLGHHAEKHSVMGRQVQGKDIITPLGVIKGKSTYIPSTSQKGSADITSTIYGLSVKIEVKKGKDRQSPDQKKYEQQIKKAGGIYLIVKDEDDFFVKFNELLEHPTIQLLKDI